MRVHGGFWAVVQHGIADVRNVCAGQLERFVTDAAELDTLRACFAGLWGLDDLSDSNTSDAVQAAIAEPDKYILKPQREGGGNNLYGVITAGSVLEL